MNVSKNDKLNFLTTVEPVIDDLRDVDISEKSCLRSQLVTALKCAIDTKNLPSEELQALEELKTDNSIVTSCNG